MEDDILEVVSVQVAHLQTGDILSCSRTGVIVGRVRTVIGMLITIDLELVPGRRWRLDLERLDVGRTTLPIQRALRSLILEAGGPSIGVVLECCRQTAPKRSF